MSNKFATIAATVAICLSTPATAQEVKLGGTGAALATIRMIAAEFGKADPAIKISVVPNLGTSGSIKAVAAGAIDIALATRGISEDERTAGLVDRAYARTPFVLAARKGANFPLSSEAIADIYAGRRLTWPDGAPIRLVLRQASDSDITTLKTLSPGVKTAVEAALKREGMVFGLTDQDAADRIEKLPGGIGTTTLALILSEQRPLDPLALDGVVPSVQALESGSYRLAKTLYLVHRASASDATRRFVTFFASEPARRILRENGQLPR